MHRFRPRQSASQRGLWWHPVDPKADPYDPSTVWTSGHYAYTGRWAKNNSAFVKNSVRRVLFDSLEEWTVSISTKDDRSNEQKSE